MTKSFSALDLQKMPVVGLVPESSASAPTTPRDGQLWYDTATPGLRIYDTVGGVWRLVYDARTGAPLVHGHALTDANMTGIIPDAQLPARLAPAMVNITDFNTATSTGWYKGFNATNSPGTGDYLLEVFAYSTVALIQRAYRLGMTAADTLSWQRYCNAGVFGAWFALELSAAEQAAAYAPIVHGHALTDANITGLLPDAQTPVRLASGTVSNQIASNFNTATASGWYWGGPALTNVPTAADPSFGWLVFVEAYDATYSTQTACKVGMATATNSYTYRRHCVASVWGAWYKIGLTASEQATSLPAASETVQGKVELATAAETTTGTDNTRAVHPAGLKVELDKHADKIFATDTLYKRFTGLLTWRLTVTNGPGAIAITTPITLAAVKMHTIHITGFNYTGFQNSTIDLLVSFYGSTSPVLVNHSVANNGTCPIHKVTIARNIAAGTITLFIEIKGGVWNNPGIAVADYNSGWTVTSPDAWLTGWSAALVTDITTGYDLAIVAPAGQSLRTYDQSVATNPLFIYRNVFNQYIVSAGTTRAYELVTKLPFSDVSVRGHIRFSGSTTSAECDGFFSVFLTSTGPAITNLRWVSTSTVPVSLRAAINAAGNLVLIFDTTPVNWVNPKIQVLELAVAPTALDASTMDGWTGVHQLEATIQSSYGAAGTNSIVAPVTDRKVLQELDAITSGPYKTVRVATTVGQNVTTLAGGAPLVVDGVTLLLGDRVLVKNQTTASQNGIYTVSVLGTGADGTWVRATDADTAIEMAGVTAVVQRGTAQGGQFWHTNFIGTLNSTAMNWFQVIDSSQTASETVAGISEIATQAETNTGTDDLRSVTPLKLQTKLLGYQPVAAAVLAPVRVATLSNITLSGLQTVDGVALAAGDRVLVRGQTTGSQNGIYVVVTPGAWTRATDADTAAEVQRGVRVSTSIEGATNRLKTFTQLDVIATVGTDVQTWRVHTYVDIGGIFATPQPNGTGHMFFDQNNKTIRVFDGGDWQDVRAPIICTSTTRPGFPYEGVTVYETDTGSSSVFIGVAGSGGSWRSVGASDTGWIALALGPNVQNTGGLWALAQGRKVGPVLHLRGLVSLTSTLVAGALVATIPTTLTGGVSTLGYLQSPFPEPLLPSGGSFSGGRIDCNPNLTITTLASITSGSFVRLFATVYLD